MTRFPCAHSNTPKAVPPLNRPEQVAAPHNINCTVQDRSVDESRPLRVVIIGAGISGILVSIQFKQRVPNMLEGLGMRFGTLDVPADKRIAVIGNGSSGIQLVPGILPKVTLIDHYIAPTFARDEVEKRGEGLENFEFTCDDIETFQKDHEAHQMLRKLYPRATLIGHPMQVGARDMFAENMKRRLANKPELFDDLVPGFPPTCRRLTLGPGYLEALTDKKVDMISSEIVQVDDTHRPIDVIVCATGLDTSLLPDSPSGAGVALPWRSGGKRLLRRICQLPQMDSPTTSSVLDQTLGWARVIGLLQEVCAQTRDNIRTMSILPEAVKSFTKYCDHKCRSWYKGGSEEGRITVLWLGLSVHSMKVFENPRWEDFEY
ncbi:flavin-binding monooxygenase [Penicillium waksmanii]|uniref:flavin-binding monooxygenase n=1 Tax=Penicillium waksmanii TaxID=69791 RepID=UPI0025467E05|nr:flavin-binding monooxygenase [Penicillium waksmanii]KAJ5976438.1 flavin-binding monooxygenase [Penicillium waksmanii]